MKITSIKQQVKNPQRVSVFVDGKYNFSLSLDELAQIKIKNGEELDQITLKRYQKISADGKIRAASLGWLLYRPHSTREFNDYLRRKKVDPALAERLTVEFSEKKYLNDENYAKWLVELRLRKAKSNRAIMAELSTKGISRQIAELALEDSSAEATRLQALINKKQHLPKYQKDQNKFISYLLSKGFSYNDIKKALDTK